jgi:hypothetical protein
VLAPVVECSSWEEVVDCILYEEVEHGAVTRLVDPDNNVVAEIDLMQTAIVGYTDRMKVRVRRHPWAVKVAKAVHDHASTEEDNYDGEKPVKSTVEERGWACSYKVRIVWD